MRFERFEVKDLAHYSYVIGCATVGKMAVVDPKRDVDTYLDFADTHGFEISHVLETHIHADYASGARELALRTGAELLLSGYDEGEVYEVAFPHHKLFEGDTVEIGTIRVECRHTPGHTPEHLSYLVYDTTRSETTPMLMLSGDFLFVGGLGRPDLLGDDWKRKLAEQLFYSVREKLSDLPDGLEIYPAHGAGSMCGSGMSDRPMSTLGFERIANPYLDRSLSREEFVDKILSTVPPFPEYYKRMKRVNSRGPKMLNGLLGKRPIGVDEELRKRVEEGKDVVVDLRDHLSYGGAHIPGSFGIGEGPGLSTWASWVVPYDTPILLVSDHPERLEETVRALVRVGLDEVKGYIKGGIEAWGEAGYSLRGLKQTTPIELFKGLQQRQDLLVLDVRSDEEWKAAHVEGAINITAGELKENLDRLPNTGKELAVLCEMGYRSTVAASVLERGGFERLVNVTGGMRGWTKAGLPITSG